MVATSSGSGNAGFLEAYGLDRDTPGSVRDALDQTHGALEKADLFFGHGSDSAWDEGVFLLLSALGLPLDSGDEVLSASVSDDGWATTLAWLQERILERKPLPYVTGRAWFAGLEFLCDERALVPRSPLAELIRNNYAPWWTGESPQSLLDLCCGGGCIGIAAAVHQPNLEVVIADIDEAALTLARENIGLHKVAARVSAAQSDLLDDLQGSRFDIILCNPPYVDAEDLAAMPAEFLAEPPLALGSGSDGLDISRRLLRNVGDYLTPRGLLFLEVGNSWEALDSELAGLPLTWIEFSEGGHGVLVLRADEVPEIARSLAARP
ncbi:50S ribosomal protein L3 N(5)-glutamine methyltransferase [Congregibacter litoralis]|uniref:[LSU ribosomal protein L3P]-glutamine N5-methyltransferase n=1 Tax=Congregibacter litoralis KT71 TaxID=314285 RepID=A4A3J8_9GAMM|nr:50S ribosomal protein L3 N(5)-glutamine methyltransferase [Congregibacter litoralis]EAQ99271.1 [LSU ribosomal protein L3P]-glutamine N5-methyltransferase [Congregibacter litoralis KT71]